MSNFSRPCSASTCDTFGARCYPHMKDYSMNPKVSNYQCDGYGRDSYIKIPNGGFRKAWNNTYKTTYWVRNGSCENVKATRFHPKFPIYKSNGFGRDSYIYKNDGGFFQASPLYNGNNTSVTCFVSSWRDKNERFRSLYIKKNDYLNFCKNFRTPKEKKEIFAKSTKQRAFSARLARPKK